MKKLRKGVMIDPEAAELLEIEVGDKVHDGQPVSLREINFDGIVGPSHNYAGLSLGNVASMNHAGQISQPRAAALAGSRKDAREPGARAGPGHFPAAPATQPRVAHRAWRGRSSRRAGSCCQRHVRVGDVGGKRCDGLAGAGYGRRQVPPDRREPQDHAAPQP